MARTSSGGTKLENELEILSEDEDKNEYEYLIYETNKYLFLARIHFKDSTVIPEIGGDPIAYTDLLLQYGRKIRSRIIEESKCLTPSTERVPAPDEPMPCSRNFEIESEINMIKEVLEKIQSGRWDDLREEKIIESQTALQKILRIVVED